jgi:hypothetical protein
LHTTNKHIVNQHFPKYGQLEKIINKQRLKKTIPPTKYDASNMKQEKQK